MSWFSNAIKSVGKVLTAPASLITSGIGAAANLISGHSTNKSNERIASAANQAQMDIAKYQADRNLELWNLNNEYNSPQAQMDRYKAAGLNPHLIYGEGSASSGNSSSPAQSFSAPVMKTARMENYMPNVTQLLMNGLMMSSQIQKTNSDTAINYQQLENLEQDNALKRLMVIQQQLINSKTKDEAELWKNRLFAEIGLMDSRSVLARSQSQLADSNRFSVDALRPLQVAETKQRVSYILAQTIGQQIENQLSPYRRRMLEEQISNYIADRYLTNQRTSGQRFSNTLDRILVRNGLNLRTDELDRLEYQLRQGIDLGTFKSAKMISRFGGAFLGK